MENQNLQSNPKSEKGYVPMILLCFFVGGLGVHRFYACSYNFNKNTNYKLLSY